MSVFLLTIILAGIGAVALYRWWDRKRKRPVA